MGFSAGGAGSGRRCVLRRHGVRRGRVASWNFEFGAVTTEIAQRRGLGLVSRTHPLEARGACGAGSGEARNCSAPAKVGDVIGDGVISRDELLGPDAELHGRWLLAPGVDGPSGGAARGVR